MCIFLCFGSKTKQQIKKKTTAGRDLSRRDGMGVVCYGGCLLLWASAVYASKRKGGCAGRVIGPVMCVSTVGPTGMRVGARSCGRSQQMRPRGASPAQHCARGDDVSCSVGSRPVAMISQR